MKDLHTIALSLLLLINLATAFIPTARQHSIQKQRQKFHGLSSASSPIPIIAPSSSSLPFTSNTTITFPSYAALSTYKSGEYLSSDRFTISSQTFSLLLYPRGGGHTRRRGNIFASPPDAVGLYLRYHPVTPGAYCDATFRLLLKGTQATGPRFDLEWTGGMRFVSSEDGDLRGGVANDFGAHLMQAELLPLFMGVSDGDDGEGLRVAMSVTIHEAGTRDDDVKLLERRAHSEWIPRDIKSDENAMRCGNIVVPLLTSLSQRPALFAAGVYPGVEYRVMRILAPSSNNTVFRTCQDEATLELKPVYSLVPELERSDWPVAVPQSFLPKLVTPKMYNVISAAGSLLTALSAVGLAYVLSLLFSFYVIPSKSMDPTFRVGDVLLVEKVTPKVRNVGVNDVVLFTPPPRLVDIVAGSAGKAQGGASSPVSPRDLFVKRVAATEGQIVTTASDASVRIDGEIPEGRRDLCEAEPLRLIEKYVNGGSKIQVGEGELFVLGDCADVSVDSRVWGPLRGDNVMGRPVWRVWPPDRFGFAERGGTPPGINAADN